MDNDKIKLDDSILEDIDTDIDLDEQEENEKKKTSIFDEEISIDDLFDFKPKGYVGDNEDFFENSLIQKQEMHKQHTYKTKKQKLEAILENDVNFIDAESFKPVDDEYPNNKTTNNMQQDTSSQEPKQRQETKKSKPSTIKEEDVIFSNQNVHDFNQYNEQTTGDEEYDPIKVRSLIESALYICGNDGVGINDLKRLTGISSGEIKKIMKSWINELENDDKRGITIKIFGERYKLFSKACNREDLSKLITVRYRNPLSSKVMETLAIIAYNQPCTRSVIENIRAKDPTVTIQKLIDLGLVIEAGRADTPGRPLLYTVTHKFYDIFGIKNLNELPKINTNQPFEDSDVSFFDTTRYNE